MMTCPARRPTAGAAAPHHSVHGGVHGGHIARYRGAIRTPAHVARDKYRHPLEMMKFFGLKRECGLHEE